MVSVIKLQQALKEKGYNPGPVDGVIGRRTIAAIKKFQEDKLLVVDGVVGPETLSALFPNGVPDTSGVVVPVSMPWLAEAYRLIGTKEKPGAGSNEAILGWGKTLRIDYSNDEIPWCGLFVAHCIGAPLQKEPLPANPLAARSWQKFGTECAVPQPGAVMIFWRGKPSGWKGHVGFYWAEDDTCYHVLGGNQSNSVSVVRINKKRFLATRWPISTLPPQGVIRLAAKDGRLLSHNEA